MRHLRALLVASIVASAAGGLRADTVSIPIGPDLDALGWKHLVFDGIPETRFTGSGDGVLRVAAPVPNMAFVDRAVQIHSATPNASQTLRALTTPSSWKPLPQYAPQKWVRRSTELTSDHRARARWPSMV